ncbi:hypothetical protein L1987_81621 [Smallanthus sonchifolius]|uniref:Uncharacterized protein n=1 Tax=Smallanthus sonchifolius TaxID=185202 RepID=A0ACB8YS17_9ASTR|nr:hypothetical protein L1987_81621 [Smallanthus sonchifolius]
MAGETPPSHRRDPIMPTVGNAAVQRRRQHAVSVAKERREAMFRTKRLCMEGISMNLDAATDGEMMVAEEPPVLESQTFKAVEELKLAVSFKGKDAVQKKVNALRELRRLLSRSGFPFVEVALKSGAIPLLAQCLSFGSEDEQVLEAAWCLTNIAAGHQNKLTLYYQHYHYLLLIWELLVKPDMHLTVTPAPSDPYDLQLRSSHLKINKCLVDRNKLIHASLTKVVQESNRLWPSTILIYINNLQMHAGVGLTLKCEKSSLSVSEQCAWALGNVAGESDELRDLISQGALIPLAKMMLPDNGSTVRTAAWALSVTSRVLEHERIHEELKLK